MKIDFSTEASNEVKPTCCLQFSGKYSHSNMAEGHCWSGGWLFNDLFQVSVSAQDATINTWQMWRCQTHIVKSKNNLITDVNLLSAAFPMLPFILLTIHWTARMFLLRLATSIPKRGECVFRHRPGEKRWGSGCPPLTRIPQAPSARWKVASVAQRQRIVLVQNLSADYAFTSAWWWY